MGTLTKGMSYRRQGSSGLIWAENFTVREDGVFGPKEGNFMRTPAGVNDGGETSTGSPRMERSKSVGSSFHATPAQASNHKSGFRVVRWLKKTFTRIRGWFGKLVRPFLDTTESSWIWCWDLQQDCKFLRRLRIVYSQRGCKAVEWGEVNSAIGQYVLYSSIVCYLEAIEAVMTILIHSWTWTLFSWFVFKVVL